MQVKTSELIDLVLDGVVAKCEGITLNDGNTISNDCDVYSPSTDWSQGGPIIEREGISLEWSGWGGDEQWIAYLKHDDEFKGPTPLIAAMRCYVSSKLGDEVDIPDELMQ